MTRARSSFNNNKIKRAEKETEFDVERWVIWARAFWGPRERMTGISSRDSWRKLAFDLPFMLSLFLFFFFLWVCVGFRVVLWSVAQKLYGTAPFDFCFPRRCSLCLFCLPIRCSSVRGSTGRRVWVRQLPQRRQYCSTNLAFLQLKSRKADVQDMSRTTVGNCAFIWSSCFASFFSFSLSLSFGSHPLFALTNYIMSVFFFFP